jgi:hypothetical protein
MNKLLTFVVFFLSNFLIAQNHHEQQIENVFNTLVLAYGNPKTPPRLIIINDKTKQSSPAVYSPEGKPTIKIDYDFYQLCRSFDKDSLNALSIVISHELAHFYHNHSFCSDFAFAVSKKNKDYAQKLKAVSKTEKISLETQADYHGLFYAAIAGYQPFEIYPKLLDEVYKTYQLAENDPRYPTKQERKYIAQNALQKVEQLYQKFENSKILKEQKKYKEAVILLEDIATHFPSREMYNNIGVLKTLQALDLKPLTLEQHKFPKRFLYPLEFDNTTRLQQNNTRSTDNDLQKMNELLKSAQKDFEKAIAIDPIYTNAYINLACVFDLLENPEAAIGKIKELPKEQQARIDAKRILAIAYYHADNEKKAEEIWKEIEK